MKRYELAKEQWDVLGRPQWSAVAGIAGGVWPLAVHVCAICQAAGRQAHWKPYSAHCLQMQIWKT